jgi:hypothetical protein
MSPPLVGCVWTLSWSKGRHTAALLFYLFVDAIVRNIDFELPHLSTTVKKVFYADDGKIGGDSTSQVQEAFSLVSDQFDRLGLFVNKWKTVTMSNRKFFRAIHEDTHTLLPEQLGETYEQRSQKYIACPLCDRTLQVRSFVRHCRHIHPNNDKPELCNLIYMSKSKGRTSALNGTLWMGLIVAWSALSRGATPGRIDWLGCIGISR